MKNFVKIKELDPTTTHSKIKKLAIIFDLVKVCLTSMSDAMVSWKEIVSTQEQFGNAESFIY